MSPHKLSPRAQDVLFAVFGLAVAGMLALKLDIAVFALFGAFACGSIYLLGGMLPGREEPFGTRALTTLFLSLVLASLCLILPATFGPGRPGLRRALAVIAAALPFLAVGFEIARTPQPLERLRRWLRRR
jgi:hypothetical protein